MQELSPGALTADDALAVVYPLLGAGQYVAISRSVLSRMYGDATCARVRDQLPVELRAQIRRLAATLASPDGLPGQDAGSPPPR